MAFLKYGEGDSNLVFRHPLTSQLSADDISGIWTTFTTNPNGNPEADPILGSIAVNNGNEADYLFEDYIGPDLTTGFQISIAVQTDWVAAQSSDVLEPEDNGSRGYIPVTAETVLSAISLYSDVSTPAQILYTKNTGINISGTFVGAYPNSDFLLMENTGPGVGQIKINSYGKDDYTTLNFGVVGDVVAGTAFCVFGVDGYPFAYANLSNVQYDNPLNDFYIGSDRRIANRFVDSHYFKNLQIIAESPDFGESKNIVFGNLSDSLTHNGTYASYEAFEINYKYGVQRNIFLTEDKYFPEINVSENGGFSISFSIDPNYTDQLINALPGVLATNPIYMLICGGTNDSTFATLGNYSGEDFTTDYQDLIENVAGVNGNPETTVKFLMITTAPPRAFNSPASPIGAALLDINSRISDLPEWFENTYPESDLKIVVVDNYNNMGADYNLADPAIYPQNTLDGVHFGSEWTRIYTKGVTDAIFAFENSNEPPILLTPYPAQASNVNDLINFDISQGWIRADGFEIARLAPGFILNEETNLLEGTVTTNMNYTMYVRGVKFDDSVSGGKIFSNWEPLPWTATGATSARITWGLSFDYQDVIAAATPANIFIKQAGINGYQTTYANGLMLINDIEDDGSASSYDASFVTTQILNNKTAATLIRASAPGWEIIVDTDLG